MWSSGPPDQEASRPHAIGFLPLLRGRNQTAADSPMTTRGQEVGQGLLRVSSAQALGRGSRRPGIPTGGNPDGLLAQRRSPELALDGRHLLAQLERSRNGGHVSHALYCRGDFVGRFDQRGWHAASAKSLRRRPRSVVGSLPLPLAS
jgi:hypothetical protein